jgi:hypothetical protein
MVIAVAWALILGCWCGRAESKHNSTSGSIMYGVFLISSLDEKKLLLFVLRTDVCKQENAVVQMRTCGLEHLTS